jgi:hypothetical protein
MSISAARPAYAYMTIDCGSRDYTECVKGHSSSWAYCSENGRHWITNDPAGCSYMGGGMGGGGGTDPTYTVSP